MGPLIAFVIAALPWTHAVPADGVATAPTGTRPAKVVDMQGKNCTAADCHDDLLTKKVLHGPVGQSNCDACHAQPKPKVHAFTYTHDERKLCEACHTMQLKNFVHEPLREGKCTGCHDPHQSDHRFILRDDPAEKLCLRCHKDDALMKSKYLHGPVAAGNCILCHEAHSSWNAKLVVRRGRELCLFCHEDVDRRLGLARHVHQPVREECDVCHDPHGSAHPMQLKDSKEKLCVGCHEDIGKLIGTSDHVHGAVSEQDGCGNCHNAHGTTLPRLLRKPLMDICLGCHNRRMDLPGGKKLTDMASLLKDNPDHHGPVRRADCNACHNPHASANFRLLSKVYPKYFYAPFDLGNYDLCFQCHMRDMVLVKNGRGLTRFKDGTLNLHFVHVNKAEKGRTCRACHEVHASTHPAHVRDAVPFGPSGWQFKLNFQKTKTGGTCAPACHRPKEYVRAAGDPDLPAPRETMPGGAAGTKADQPKKADGKTKEKQS